VNQVFFIPDLLIKMFYPQGDIVGLLHGLCPTGSIIFKFKVLVDGLNGDPLPA
jgi:hypothetical protein